MLFTHFSPYILAVAEIAVKLVSTTATSISLSWSVPSGPVVEGYEVKWRPLSDSTGSPQNEGDEVTSGVIAATSYTLEGLETRAVYNITVTVHTAQQITVSQPIITSTGNTAYKLLHCWLTLSIFSLLPAPECDESDFVPMVIIIGSAVAGAVFLAVAVLVVVIIIVAIARCCRGKTASKKPERYVYYTYTILHACTIYKQ